MTKSYIIFDFFTSFYSCIIKSDCTYAKGLRYIDLDLLTR